LIKAGCLSAFIYFQAKQLTFFTEQIFIEQVVKKTVMVYYINGL